MIGFDYIQEYFCNANRDREKSVSVSLCVVKNSLITQVNDG